MTIIQIEQGKLQGIKCFNNGEHYIAFNGIPYATPPLGALRFKAPEPPHPWAGIRDASRHGPVCPQYNERMDRIETGNEDCLYLNVYTKNVNPPEALPVMVWIHGGGFYTGSGNSDFYGPDFFMAHDMVLVTINYRLEVLGFLCLDNEEVPGNAGLKDQVAALKWVKENISAFGGDVDNVTIFGCSAGAVSVSYHLISKMSKGLFNKAICQSGICLNEWGYNLYGKERAFQLGKLLGRETKDPNRLLQFLRSVPVSSLVKIQLPHFWQQYEDLSDGIFFGPVVEKEDLNVEKFITEEPHISVRIGKIANVPIIVGYTSGEGIEIGRRLVNIAGYIAKVGTVVPRELKLKMSPKKVEELDKAIRKYYFDNKDITPAILQEYSDFESDRLFAYNIVRFGRYHDKHNNMPVYLYKFSAETERNYTKKFYNMQAVKGVCHADDLPYLFNVTCLNIPLTDESREIIQSFVQLWVNFARTGNPTYNRGVQWKQFTNQQRYCFIIDKECKCVQNEGDANFKFWEEIYEETYL